MPRLRRTLAGLAGLLALAVLPGHVALAASLVEDDGPTRILLVGDSVTQGSSGDWTWRYRLWQHLEDSGAPVDLVGPRDDLLDNVTGRFGSQAYADPRFDRDHAARWGMKLLDEDASVRQLVEEQHPDVVVELLGVNDLVWDHRSPEEVVGYARTFVEDVRAADPTADVVLGELPQGWVAGVPAYDAELADLAAELSTPGSRVVAAAPVTPFVQGVDTWDPAHPSASGEVKIAAGVADALARLGIGHRYPRPLPLVPDVPRPPPELRVVPGEGQATLTWQLPPGATAAYVWVRDASHDGRWTRLPEAVEGDTFTAGGLTDGDTYEFRVQAVKGWIAPDDVYSGVVTAVPGPLPSPSPSPSLPSIPASS